MSEKSLEILFNEAANKIKEDGKNLNLTNEDLLSIYGFFKQASVGDCIGVEPGFFDIKGKAKYNAWKECIGMTKEKAMQRYIKKVNKLVEGKN